MPIIWRYYTMLCCIYVIYNGPTYVYTIHRDFATLSKFRTVQRLSGSSYDLRLASPLLPATYRSPSTSSPWLVPPDIFILIMFKRPERTRTMVPIGTISTKRVGRLRCSLPAIRTLKTHASRSEQGGSLLNKPRSDSRAKAVKTRAS